MFPKLYLLKCQHPLYSHLPEIFCLAYHLREKPTASQLNIFPVNHAQCVYNSTIPVTLLEHTENVMVLIVSQNGISTLFQIPIPLSCQNPKFSLMAAGNFKNQGLLLHLQNCGKETQVIFFFQMFSIKGSAKISISYGNV